MAEFTGYAFFAEIPAVIWDVQRMGPSTGLPTRVSQGDVLKIYFLGHGDCRHIVLLPGQCKNASNSARRRSIWPSGCRRRSSC